MPAAAMSSVERVQTVLQGGVPDRVPVDLHNFLMCAEAPGLPFPEYLQDGEAVAKACGRLLPPD